MRGSGWKDRRAVPEEEGRGREEEKGKREESYRGRGMGAKWRWERGGKMKDGFLEDAKVRAEQ